MILRVYWQIILIDLTRKAKSIFEQSGLKGKNTEQVNIDATFKIATNYKIVVFYWETPLYIDSLDIKSWFIDEFTFGC